MTNSPTITVLMSVYNGAKYLQESINSILDQTCRDFEFIIIDDASTDETPDILKSNLDPRIKVITNTENMGLTKSLNLGLDNARGMYIARMDADDISNKNRLKEQKEFLDLNKEIACVGSEMIVIDSSGRQTGLKKQHSDPDLLSFLMLLKNQMIHSSVMFRRDVAIEVGGYDESFKYAQDYDLWSRLILNGYHISNITKPLIKYRLHDKSITQGATKDRAYAFAMTTTFKNINNYIKLTSGDFEILMMSLHNHRVDSIRDLKTIWIKVNQLMDAYFYNIKTSKMVTNEIKRYCNNIKYNSFKWYIKSNFAGTYHYLILIKNIIYKK